MAESFIKKHYPSENKRKKLDYLSEGLGELGEVLR